MNAFWIEIPTNTFAMFALLFIFGVVALSAFVLTVIVLMLRAPVTIILIFAITTAASVGAIIAVDSTGAYEQTRTLLSTDYNLPDGVGETLLDDLFSNKRGNSSLDAQPDGASATYTDPATNETTEYRILTNGKLMKLQMRTLADTANGTADETAWTDMAPLTAR